jgi:hypothetical protein
MGLDDLALHPRIDCAKFIKDAENKKSETQNKFKIKFKRLLKFD